MIMSSGYIYLRHLRFHAFHGVMPQERIVGNEYDLSLRIGYPLDKCMDSDDVADTLNYAEVFQLARQEMSIPSQLLERVAARIGERLFSQFPHILSVDIELTKLNPPMEAACQGAGVELHLISNKTDNP